MPVTLDIDWVPSLVAIGVAAIAIVAIKLAEAAARSRAHRRTLAAIEKSRARE